VCHDGPDLERTMPSGLIEPERQDRAGRIHAIKRRPQGAIGEDIDTTIPAGRLVFHVFASIAQFERERISERTKEGLEAARKRGRVSGSPLPYRQLKKKKPAVCAILMVEICHIAQLFKVH
jgi:DNA invertase Pin-like site-specific DNA recombinase